MMTLVPPFKRGNYTISPMLCLRLSLQVRIRRSQRRLPNTQLLGVVAQQCVRNERACLLAVECAVGAEMVAADAVNNTDGAYDSISIVLVDLGRTAEISCIHDSDRAQGDDKCYHQRENLFEAPRGKHPSKSLLSASATHCAARGCLGGHWAGTCKIAKLVLYNYY